MLNENDWEGWKLLEDKTLDYILFKHEKEHYGNLFLIINNKRIRMIVDLTDFFELKQTFKLKNGEIYISD